MNKDLQKIQNELSTGSIGSYIHWVNQIPLLTEEEEKDLTERLHKNNDLEAARKLVMSHLRVVVKMARGYLGYGLPLGDLIQEGNIGLMKAVKRFDPAKGVRLVTFAIHWIRAEMHEYIIKNWRIVKIATTKAQRKLFFNLRKASKKLGWFSDAEVKTVAESLNVPEKEVRQMEARLANVDQAFDGYNDSDNDEDFSAPVNYLIDQGDNPEKTLIEDDHQDKQQALLHQAIKELDERSQDILRQRWLDEDNKATLHELAKKYGVSAERIRQLENNAMKKIREQLLVAA